MLTCLCASRDTKPVFDAHQGRSSVLKTCCDRCHLPRATRQGARARLPAGWIEQALARLPAEWFEQALARLPAKSSKQALARLLA